MIWPKLAPLAWFDWRQDFWFKMWQMWAFLGLLLSKKEPITYEAKPSLSFWARLSKPDIKSRMNDCHFAPPFSFSLPPTHFRPHAHVRTRAHTRTFILYLFLSLSHVLSYNIFFPFYRIVVFSFFLSLYYRVSLSHFLLLTFLLNFSFFNLFYTLTLANAFFLNIKSFLYFNIFIKFLCSLPIPPLSLFLSLFLFFQVSLTSIFLFSLSIAFFYSSPSFAYSHSLSILKLRW